MKDTIQVRAPKKLMQELNIKFPNIPNSKLIQFMYDTSLLKLESGLRKVNAKTKRK